MSNYDLWKLASPYETAVDYSQVAEYYGVYEDTVDSFMVDQYVYDLQCIAEERSAFNFNDY